jgi:tRNA(fMet)-specific endonuclease VapC
VGRRLILDTNVLIAYKRGTFDRAALREDELSIAAITLAEYRVGIEMADTVERAATRSRWLDVVLAEVEILEYTRNTADHHARLLAHVRRTGAPRGAHDLIIAAHAAETGRTVISRDAKARFENLPGVLSVTAT